MIKILICLLALFAFDCDSQDGSDNLVPLGTVHIEDMEYVYGLDNSDPEGGDGYLVIKGLDYDRLLIFDEGGREEVVYVADLGFDRIGVVIECYLEDDQGEFYRKRSLVKLMDKWGNQIISAGVTRKILGFGNYHHLLVLETEYKIEYYDYKFAKYDFVSPALDQSGSFSYHYQGLAYINEELADEIDITYPGHYNIEIVGHNHSVSFDVTVHPVTSIDIDGGIFDEAVTIVSEGELILNETPILSQTSITEPGYYELVIRGQNGYLTARSFTIIAVIENIENNEIVDPPVQIMASGSNQTLNGEPYHGEEIYDAGYYEFAVWGAGGYQKHLSFTINPIAEGVIDNQSYMGEVLLSLNCEATLNGSAITRDHVISQAGTYELVLFLEGESHSTIHFTITENEPNNHNWFIDNLWLVVFAGLAIVGLALVFKKR